VALQLAIGDGGDLSLWCVDRGFTPDGGQKFWVINGHWAGVYRRGVVIIDEDGHRGRRIPARLLWRGVAPFADEDYNEAMAWMRKQLKRKPELKTFFEGMEFNMTKMTFGDAVEKIEVETHNERVTSLASAYAEANTVIAELTKKLAGATAYREELASKGAAAEELSDEEFSELYNRQFKLR
jgi:hypothetical protein